MITDWTGRAITVSSISVTYLSKHHCSAVSVLKTRLECYIHDSTVADGSFSETLTVVHPLLLVTKHVLHLTCLQISCEFSSW